MRCLSVLALVAAAPLLLADQPTAVSWGELSQTIQPDWTVRMMLPDGTTVEGKSARFEPDALSIRIVRTSNKALHPKGEFSIPKARVRLIEVRKNRHTARRIGTLVPVVAGIAVGVGLAATATSDCREIVCAVAAGYGAGIGLAVAAVGGTVGYIIGRSVDRRFETFTVTAP